MLLITDQAKADTKSSLLIVKRHILQHIFTEIAADTKFNKYRGTYQR